jgi:gliding motility-associated-like protein
MGIIFDGGFEVLITKSDYINAHRVVPANFSSKDSISDQVFVFEHTEPLDTGVDYTFTWDIDIPGFTPGSSQRQIVTFPDSGIYTVSLTVADEFGCSSTSATVISIIEEITIQNVFTPNDDHINDNFIVTSNGGFPIIVKVFTRAGILVYEGEGTTVTWDGHTASGQKLKPGIYFYAIKALNGDPEKKYTKAGVLYMYE